jgi:hypothetical protein
MLVVMIQWWWLPRLLDASNSMILKWIYSMIQMCNMHVINYLVKNQLPPNSVFIGPLLTAIMTTHMLYHGKVHCQCFLVKNVNIWTILKVAANSEVKAVMRTSMYIVAPYWKRNEVHYFNLHICIFTSSIVCENFSITMCTLSWMICSTLSAPFKIYLAKKSIFSSGFSHEESELCS